MEPKRNVIAFFVLAITNNFCFNLMQSAANNIIDGKAPAGVVLLADVFPGFLLVLVYPLFQHLVQIKTVVLISSSFAIIGLTMVAASGGNVFLALIGVCFVSMQKGLGETTLLTYSSLFQTSCISAWGSGTGLAGLLSAAIYMVMQTMLGVSNEVIMYCSLPIMAVYLGAFFVSKPVSRPILEQQDGLIDVATENTTENTTETVSSKNETPLESNKDLLPHKKLENDVMSKNVQQKIDIIQKLEAQVKVKTENITADAASADKYIKGLTGIQRLRLLKPQWLNYFCIFAGYTLRYSVGQGVNPSFKFPDLPGYYTYSCFTLYVGSFIARSSLSCFKMPYITLPMACGVQLINLIVMFLNAKFYFLSVWPTLIYVAFVGYLGGILYVNCLYYIKQRSQPLERKFLMSNATLFLNIGTLAACGIGSGLQIILKKME